MEELLLYCIESSKDIINDIDKINKTKRKVIKNMDVYYIYYYYFSQWRLLKKENHITEMYDTILLNIQIMSEKFYTIYMNNQHKDLYVRFNFKTNKLELLIDNEIYSFDLFFDFEHFKNLSRYIYQVDKYLVSYSKIFLVRKEEILKFIGCFSKIKNRNYEFEKYIIDNYNENNQLSITYFL